MFKAAWSETGGGRQKVHTYEEILREYEKFFSLEDELNKGRKRGQNLHGGYTKGENVPVSIKLTFVETIEGTDKVIDYTRLKLCKECDGKKIKNLSD